MKGSKKVYMNFDSALFLKNIGNFIDLFWNYMKNMCKKGAMKKLRLTVIICQKLPLPMVNI